MARRKRCPSQARASGKDVQTLKGAIGGTHENNKSRADGSIEAPQLPHASQKDESECLPCDSEVENVSPLVPSSIDPALGQENTLEVVTGQIDQEPGAEVSADSLRTKRKASQDNHVLEPSKKCKGAENKGVPGRKLACPYFKRNPSKYVAERSCSGPGWSSVHRLKEHLYRRHQLPNYCRRCNRGFTKQREFDSHVDSVIPCSPGSPPKERHDDGFNERQKKELRSKKNRQQSSEEQRWFEVYEILFPSDDPHQRPSPFYDYKISLQDANANNCLNAKIKIVLKERLEEVASKISSHMADSLQNISSQGLSVISSQIPAQARQLVPNMKNELDRVCRAQHELVLDEIIIEIIRITRDQQIDVSGRNSDPSSIDDGEAQSPRSHEIDERTMCNNQSQYELTPATTEACIVSSDNQGQEPYGDIPISGDWQTPQRTYSGSTVTADANWLWQTCSEGNLEGVDQFKAPVSGSYWSIADPACQTMIPDSWDSRALTTGIGGWDCASVERDLPS